MRKIISGFVIFLFIQDFSSGFETQELEDDADFYDITDKDLTFRLYTRGNPETPQILATGDKARLKASNFNPSLPTKIVTHGYMNSGTTGFILRMKNGFLKTQNVNFISLDWSPCSKNLLYNKAVKCMKTAAFYSGEFIKFLQKEGKLNTATTHLIGHSLGAHLLALASKFYGPQKTIGRITGLDPAGPLFENAVESERINPNSAKFVDVIHTCRIFTGIRKPVGTVDFYPNGGYYQPGCSKFDQRCHHSSSHKYFIQSIENIKKFVGNKCDSLESAINGTCSGVTATMGYHSDKSSPGIYYLKLTEE